MAIFNKAQYHLCSFVFLIKRYAFSFCFELAPYLNIFQYPFKKTQHDAKKMDDLLPYILSSSMHQVNFKQHNMKQASAQHILITLSRIMCFWFVLICINPTNDHMMNP